MPCHAMLYPVLYQLKARLSDAVLSIRFELPLILGAVGKGQFTLAPGCF